MSELTQQRIANLNDIWAKGQWFGRKPHGAYTMAEAVTLIQANENLVIALVTWWDILPAGFTWVTLLDAQPRDGNYSVMLQTEPQERIGYIHEDEAVAVYWTNQFHDSDLGD